MSQFRKVSQPKSPRRPCQEFLEFFLYILWQLHPHSWRCEPRAGSRALREAGVTRRPWALTQKHDRLSPTTVTAGLPCMRAAVFGWAASRSFPYSRTANFRAMATLATPLLPRRHFNR